MATAPLTTRTTQGFRPLTISVIDAARNELLGKNVESLDASEFIERRVRGKGDIEDLPHYADYTIEQAPSVYIGRLILAQAAHDALKERDCEDRQDAREFLTADSIDLRFVCGMAKVNVKYLIETWKARLANVISTVHKVDDDAVCCALSATGD